MNNFFDTQINIFYENHNFSTKKCTKIYRLFDPIFLPVLAKTAHLFLSKNRLFVPKNGKKRQK